MNKKKIILIAVAVVAGVSRHKHPAFRRLHGQT